MELINEILQAIWQMFLEMSPFLLLGFFIAGILHVLMPKSMIAKQIGEKSVWSTIKATLLGVPIPLCSCGVIPTGVSFYKNGASKGATNGFLISTPQTGVDSVLITSSLMNWPWAIARPIIALITGIFGGILTDKMASDSDEMPVIEAYPSTEIGKKEYWFLAIIKYAFFEFLPDISRQLVVGIVIAVAISVFVPPTVFSDHLTNPFLNMLVVLIASIPLYVCATGSVPIATSLIVLGVSPGAVLVFLMAGPATNAATISVLWKSIGQRATFAYLISIVGGALFFGLIMDYALPSEWFTMGSSSLAHVHDAHTSWLAIVSAVVLIALIIIVEIKKIIPKKTIIMEKSTTYQIEGMTCSHCKKSVETNLSKLESVDKLHVDLGQQTVNVLGGVAENEVQDIINGLGFRFVRKL